MKRILTVTNPFGGRQRGETIEDAAEIDQVLAGENAHHVVQSTVDEPESAATAKAKSNK